MVRSRTVVLIPCYNEELTIENVIRDFKENMPEAEIYVYDNNCTDRTAQIAENAGAIVRKETRQGKGNVIRTMFREIDADCYIMADGDDTYPASFGPVLEKLVLEEGVDMAIGDRLSSTYFTENKRPFHNFGNKLVRWLINYLFDADVNDIMTGARAFSRDFVKSFAVMSKGFEIETEMTIFALDNRMKLAEVPIEYRDRVKGSSSKLNTYSDGLKVIMTIFTLLRDTKPMKFFGWIGGIFILVGLLFFIPIIAEYAATGLVPKFPTLIVITTTWIIGILSIFCGMILSVIKNRSRQEFERYLNLLHRRG
ncbi:MAG: glycosyltransferase [Lachnospiraceae bacterium]|nr:glycosyltransferase [Lachnospiraceae bacterium]MBR1875531.1 glycosyltransferase [Lachnospiraceae bacterium]